LLRSLLRSVTQTLRFDAALQGAIIIPIIMYVDGTWLSANGNHTAKPCLMSIGNHNLDAQHNLDSKKVRAVRLFAALLCGAHFFFLLMCACSMSVCGLTSEGPPTKKRK
jgi:hypothetical protein